MTRLNDKLLEFELLLRDEEDDIEIIGGGGCGGREEAIFSRDCFCSSSQIRSATEGGLLVSMMGELDEGWFCGS